MKIRELNKAIANIIIEVAAKYLEPAHIIKYNDWRGNCGNIYRRRVYKLMSERVALEVLDKVNTINPGWMLYKDLYASPKYPVAYGIKKYENI